MSCSHRARAASALALAAGTFLTATTHSQVHYDTIAFTGAYGTSLGLGPDLGAGVDFSSFSKPRINAAGQVAFLGNLAGTGVVAGANGSGIFTNTAGAIGAVAREGDATFGPNAGAGVQFDMLTNPVFNAAGRVAFDAVLQGTGVNGTNDRGLFSNVAGNVALIARSGPAGPTPGFESGVHISSFGRTVLNDAGKVAFEANLTGTGISFFNNSAIVTSGPSSPLTVVARAGGEGRPGTIPGTTMTLVNLPLINAAGRVTYTGPGGGESRVIVSTDDVATSVLAHELSPGARGPNMGSDLVFDHPSMGFPAFNDAGQVAFTAATKSQSGFSAIGQGAWINTAGTNNVAVYTGDAAPAGAGVTFSTVSDVAITSGGTLAFAATLSGTGVTTANDSGLFTKSGGTFSLVAREGDVAPNAGPGVVFGGFNRIGALNGTGDQAFLATLSGTGVTAENDTGLFTDAGGALAAIVREGDLFDVDPGTGVNFRIVSTIAFESSDQFTRPSGGEDGKAIAFNDAGVLTFALTFTDGSSGVFTAAVPEPGIGLTMLALAGLPVLRRQRRKG